MKSIKIVCIFNTGPPQGGGASGANRPGPPNVRGPNQGRTWCKILGRGARGQDQN